MTPEHLKRIRDRHRKDSEGADSTHTYGYHHAHADRGHLLAENERLLAAARERDALKAEAERLKGEVAIMQSGWANEVNALRDENERLLSAGKAVLPFIAEPMAYRTLHEALLLSIPRAAETDDFATGVYTGPELYPTKGEP